MNTDKEVIDMEPIRVQTKPGAHEVVAGDSLKTLSWVSYILHLIVAVAAVMPGAQVSIALLIVALVLDFVKKEDAIGTWQESHFKWRMHSVLWAGVLYVITFPVFFMFFFILNPAWICISIWFLYRIIKGMVRMNAGRALNV